MPPSMAVRVAAPTASQVPSSLHRAMAAPLAGTVLVPTALSHALYCRIVPVDAYDGKVVGANEGVKVAVSCTVAPAAFVVV